MLRTPFFAHYNSQPYFNMAFDDWLLTKVLEGTFILSARLYTWSPPAITIGLNQDSSRAVKEDLLGDTPVIRRVTGGRAVYHDQSELTYAVAMDPSAVNLRGGNGSPSQTSTIISETLQRFMARLGVATERVRSSSVQNAQPEFFHRAPCFESRAKYELLAGDRKVVASAQRRVAHVLLQHGSVKLFGGMSHPALNTSQTDTERDPDPFPVELFQEAKSHFQQEISRSFGVNLAETTPCESDQNEVRMRAERLRKNPLMTRQTIKQIAG